MSLYLWWILPPTFLQQTQTLTRASTLPALCTGQSQAPSDDGRSRVIMRSGIQILCTVNASLIASGSDMILNQTITPLPHLCLHVSHIWNPHWWWREWSALWALFMALSVQFVSFWCGNVVTIWVTNVTFCNNTILLYTHTQLTTIQTSLPHSHNGPSTSET